MIFFFFFTLPLLFILSFSCVFLTFIDFFLCLWTSLFFLCFYFFFFFSFFVFFSNRLLTTIKSWQIGTSFFVSLFDCIFVKKTWVYSKNDSWLFIQSNFIFPLFGPFVEPCANFSRLKSHSPKSFIFDFRLCVVEVQDCHWWLSQVARSPLLDRLLRMWWR